MADTDTPLPPPFFARGGQFWINGDPTLLQAGEFHYFRTPPDQWAQRLGLLRAAGFNALATYIPWRWHELTEGDADLAGRTHPMRDLAGFLDLAAGMGFWLIPRPGPYIMAETIREGIPDWVFEKYPQAAFVDQNGRALEIASYRQPDFLARVSSWYAAVFQVIAPRQITRGGRVILVQMDNEMGMLQWLRNAVDTNPHTLGLFAEFLAGARGERYTVSELREMIVHPTSGRLVEDYRRFYRGYLREYAAFLWGEARKNGLEVPPVTNIHGFGNGGKTFPIGLSQLAEAMALPGMISATDVYPLRLDEGNLHHILAVNAMTAALHNPNQPLFSIEFQAGGNPDFGGAQASLYDLHARACVSTGMRAINHYLFADGENDPLLSPNRRHDWGHPIRADGTTRSHYPRYARLSKVLAAGGEALVMARPQTAAALGFLLDQYCTEYNNGYTQEETILLTQRRDLAIFDFIARGLTLTHRAFSALEITRAALDPAHTPALWLFLDRQCPQDAQEKLAGYVRAGGRLAIVGRLPEEDFDHFPAAALREALGITTGPGRPPFNQEIMRLFGREGIPAGVAQTFTGGYDEALGFTAGGEVIACSKSLGHGRVWILGALFAANTLDDLDVFEQMALAVNGPAPFELSEWADVRLSRGEQGSFLYINNYRDDPVSTTVTYLGEPLFGGQPVELPARRGLILPLDWRISDEITLAWSTGEITAVEAGGGSLTLRGEPLAFTAELVLAGQRVRASAEQGVIRLGA